MSTPLSRVTFRDSVVFAGSQVAAVSAGDVHVKSLELEGPLVVVTPKAADKGVTMVPLGNVRHMIGVVPAEKAKK